MSSILMLLTDSFVYAVVIGNIEKHIISTTCIVNEYI